MLYYSRDENSFLRRRRTFIFALDPDLIQARFKDAETPFQRIILLLALLRTAVIKVTDWLSTDSLVFEFILIEPKEGPGLAAEKELLDVLFAEQFANGTATIETLPAGMLADRCVQRARRSLCHCLLASVKEQALEGEGATISRLTLNAVVPSLGINREASSHPDADFAWADLLKQLLLNWI